MKLMNQPIKIPYNVILKALGNKQPNVQRLWQICEFYQYFLRPYKNLTLIKLSKNELAILFLQF